MKIINLSPYRIVDRSDDAGGIVIEIEAQDATGEPKWDTVPLSPRREFLIPAGLMLSIVRHLQAVEYPLKPVPAARLPRRVARA